METLRHLLNYIVSDCFNGELVININSLKEYNLFSDKIKKICSFGDEKTCDIDDLSKERFPILVCVDLKEAYMDDEKNWGSYVSYNKCKEYAVMFSPYHGCNKYVYGVSVKKSKFQLTPISSIMGITKDTSISDKIVVDNYINQLKN